MVQVEKIYYVALWASAKGKRQRDLVEATKLTKGYVSLIWSGQKQPSVKSARKLARAIGVPFEAIQHPPDTFVARATAAINQMPVDKQPTVLEMLESLIAKT